MTQAENHFPGLPIGKNVLLPINTFLFTNVFALANIRDTYKIGSFSITSRQISAAPY